MTHVGVWMSKKELRKKISTMEERIHEHGTKILMERAKAQPNEGRIRHWETEIRAFRDGMARARKRLGEQK
jgi:uncharacterized coiled-coil DUF342 family protein